MFIETAKPSLEKYEKVISALKKEPLSEHDLMRKTNLKQTQIRVIRADLIDQNIMREALYGRTKKMEYIFDSPGLNSKIFDEFRSFKMKELDAILAYADSTGCRMDYLCNYLGDKSVGKCGKCDNDTNINNNYVLPNKWKQKLIEFKKVFFPILEVETKSINLINGIASSYYGFSSIGNMIHKCKYEGGGDFPEYLVEQTILAFKSHFKKIKFDLILHVPPTESGNLVKNFAEKISKALKIPVSNKLIKSKDTQPQKVFQNSVLKRDNVKNAFIFESPYEVRGKNILLIDDIFDSGNTVKEIGRMLTGIGAVKIAPLVIAKTIGGDIAGNS